MQVSTFIKKVSIWTAMEPIGIFIMTGANEASFMHRDYNQKVKPGPRLRGKYLYI